MESVVEEAKWLASEGVKEIVLVAQDTYVVVTSIARLVGAYRRERLPGKGSKAANASHRPRITLRASKGLCFEAQFSTVTNGSFESKERR